MHRLVNDNPPFWFDDQIFNRNSLFHFFLLPEPKLTQSVRDIVHSASVTCILALALAVISLNHFGNIMGFFGGHSVCGASCKVQRVWFSPAQSRLLEVRYVKNRAISSTSFETIMWPFSNKSCDAWLDESQSHAVWNDPWIMSFWNAIPEIVKLLVQKL